jgi:hypothetical protein
LGKLPTDGLEPFVDVRVQEWGGVSSVVVRATIFATGASRQLEVEQIAGRFELLGAERNRDLVV